MKQIEKDLLIYLLSHNDWHTSSFLSTKFDISVRTVKNYIANINEAYPHTIEAGRNGYRILNSENAQILLNDEENGIPQDVENRRNYILKKLLIEGSNLDLDELANEMCISSLTLNNELRAIKLSLSQYDLVFKTKNNIASIEGSETNKKKMISRTIYNESSDGFITLELVQSYFPEYDLSDLKSYISKELLLHKLFMDDFSIVNFILHVAITMQRTNNYSTIDSCINENNILINGHVLEIINSLSNEIKRLYNIEFLENDKYSLSVLMMTRVLKNNTNNISVSDLPSIVGEDIIDLFTEIQKSVKDIFNISLDSKDFVIRFCLHLSNMVVRLKNNITVHNPQMIQIKNKYPFIYDVSVYISTVIKNEVGYQLSEDEIAYITLHVGVLLEEKKAIKTKISTLFLCPQYFYHKSNIVDKCMPIFENDLLNVGVATTYNELLSYENYEVIISTIPFKNDLNVPIVMVSTYFTNKDILAISNMIESISHLKVIKKMESRLTTLFKEEVFYVNQDFNDQNEAINKMSDDLIKLGYVNDDFKTKLFERELISSSAYGNIAMPHPLDMCSNKSIISVSIHQNPIIWNGNKVNIVFMIAISDDFRSLFTDVFDFITELIGNEKTLSELINVKSYTEFIQYILKIYK